MDTITESQSEGSEYEQEEQEEGIKQKTTKIKRARSPVKVKLQTKTKKIKIEDNEEREEKEEQKRTRKRDEYEEPGPGSPRGGVGKKKNKVTEEDSKSSWDRWAELKTRSGDWNFDKVRERIREYMLTPVPSSIQYMELYDVVFKINMTCLYTKQLYDIYIEFVQSFYDYNKNLLSENENDLTILTNVLIAERPRAEPICRLIRVFNIMERHVLINNKSLKEHADDIYYGGFKPCFVNFISDCILNKRISEENMDAKMVSNICKLNFSSGLTL